MTSPNLTPEQLAELERLAKAAHESGRDYYHDVKVLDDIPVLDDFMEFANPAVILSLVAQLRQVQEGGVMWAQNAEHFREKLTQAEERSEWQSQVIHTQTESIETLTRVNTDFLQELKQAKSRIAELESAPSPVLNLLSDYKEENAQLREAVRVAHQVQLKADCECGGEDGYLVGYSQPVCFRCKTLDALSPFVSKEGGSA